MMVQFLVSVVGTLAFAILLGAPARLYVVCSIGGGLGWVVYLAVLHFAGSAAMGCFVATLVLATYARFASILCKAPVIAFITAGIFPLVPGAGIYYTAYYLFAGNMAMAGTKGWETLIAAGTIALGILFGFAVPQSLYEWMCRPLRRLLEKKSY